MELTEKEDNFLVMQRLIGVDVSIHDYVVKRKDDNLVLYAYRNSVGRELFYRLTRNKHIINSYAVSDNDEAVRMFGINMELQNISKW